MKKKQRTENNCERQNHANPVAALVRTGAAKRARQKKKENGSPRQGRYGHQNPCVDAYLAPNLPIRFDQSAAAVCRDAAKQNHSIGVLSPKTSLVQSELIASDETHDGLIPFITARCR